MSKRMWVEVVSQNPDDVADGEILARFQGLSITQADCLVHLGAKAPDVEIRWGKEPEGHEPYRPTHRFKRPGARKNWTKEDRDKTVADVQLVLVYKRLIGRKAVSFARYRYPDGSSSETDLLAFEQRFELMEEDNAVHV